MKLNLETYGEYDRAGSLKEMADVDAQRNLIDEPLIAEEGHYANAVFLIRSGVARVSRQHHHGHQTLSYLTPGKTFGFEEIESGWADGGERSFSLFIKGNWLPDSRYLADSAD